MKSLGNFFLFHVFLVFCSTSATGEVTSSNGRRSQQISIDGYYSYYVQPRVNVTEKVLIQLYYECLCPDCIQFETTAYKEVVQQLSNYLKIETYPYGNAETIEHNGEYEFECQHGPEECYGNKLHACALNIIQNHTAALLFNTCMMEVPSGRGSDDAAADWCGKNMNINSDPIKTCAKGEMGSKLLKRYGDESEKANFHYVPYILINGKENDGEHFMRDVCAAFANPPPPCASYL